MPMDTTQFVVGLIQYANQKNWNSLAGEIQAKLDQFGKKENDPILLAAQQKSKPYIESALEQYEIALKNPDANEAALKVQLSTYVDLLNRAYQLEVLKQRKLAELKNQQPGAIDLKIEERIKALKIFDDNEVSNFNALNDKKLKFSVDFLRKENARKAWLLKTYFGEKNLPEMNDPKNEDLFKTLTDMKPTETTKAGKKERTEEVGLFEALRAIVVFIFGKIMGILTPGKEADKIKAKMNKAVNDVVTLAEEAQVATEAVKNEFIQAMNGVPDKYKPALQQIVQDTEKMKEDVDSALKTAKDALAEVKKAVPEKVNTLTPLMQKAVDAARQIAKDAKEEELHVKALIDAREQDAELKNNKYTPMFDAGGKMLKVAHEAVVAAEKVTDYMVKTAQRAGMNIQ